MSEWISVKENLPSYVQQVLCYRSENMVCEVMEYRQKTWQIWNGQFFEPIDTSYNDVTHWMSLPETPEDLK